MKDGIDIDMGEYTHVEFFEINVKTGKFIGEFEWEKFKDFSEDELKVLAVNIHKYLSKQMEK